MTVRAATREDVFSILTLMRAQASVENPMWASLLHGLDTASNVLIIETQIAHKLIDVAEEDGKIVGVLVAANMTHPLTAQKIRNCVFLCDLSAENRWSGLLAKFVEAAPSGFILMVSARDGHGDVALSEALAAHGFDPTITIYAREKQ